MCVCTCSCVCATVYRHVYVCMPKGDVKKFRGLLLCLGLTVQDRPTHPRDLPTFHPTLHWHYRCTLLLLADRDTNLDLHACVESHLSHLPNSFSFVLLTFDSLILSRNFYTVSVKFYLIFSHCLMSLCSYNKMPEIGKCIINKINFSKLWRLRNSRSRHWQLELSMGDCSLCFQDARQFGCVIHRGKALSLYVIRYRRGKFAHSRPYIRHKSIHDSKFFMIWWPHKNSFFNTTTLMNF